MAHDIPVAEDQADIRDLLFSNLPDAGDEVPAVTPRGSSIGQPGNP